MKGFFDRFYELMSDYPNLKMVEVFEMVNAEHEEQYGFEKYTDYGSFAASRSRYFSALRQKRNNLKQKFNDVKQK